MSSSYKEPEQSNDYNIKNYQIKKTLGKGTFGKVKLGIHIPTGEKVVSIIT